MRCDDDLAPRPDFAAPTRRGRTRRSGGVIGICRNIFPETPYAAASTAGLDADLRQRAYAYAAPAEHCWRYWAGNVSVDRDSWDGWATYDAGFRAYGWEDVDWGYRLMRGSASRSTVVPELETDHHIAATTTAGRGVRAYYAGSASRRFEAQARRACCPGGGGRDPWGLAVRRGGPRR